MQILSVDFPTKIIKKLLSPYLIF